MSSSAYIYDDFKRRYLALCLAFQRAKLLEMTDISYLAEFTAGIVAQLDPDLDLVFYNKVKANPQQEGSLSEEAEFMIDCIESAMDSARQALAAAGIKESEIARRYDRMRHSAENRLLLLAHEYADAREDDLDLCLGEQWEDDLLKLLI